MKRTDQAPEIVERLLALACEMTAIVEVVAEHLAEAEVATAALEQLRAIPGLIGRGVPATARSSKPPPATSRPRRAKVAASSDAGTSPVRPTHCEAPDCGKRLVQGTGRPKHFCDPKCRGRAGRARATTADGDDSDDEGSPVPTSAIEVAPSGLPVPTLSVDLVPPPLVASDRPARSRPPRGAAGAQRALRREEPARDLAGRHPGIAGRPSGPVPAATDRARVDRRAAILAAAAARGGVA